MRKVSPILPMRVIVKFFSADFLVCCVWIDPLANSWRVPHAVRKLILVKFSHNTKYEPLAKLLDSENFVVYSITQMYMYGFIMHFCCTQLKLI